MRFFLIAGLIWKFGAPIKVFIDKYFNLLASLFAVLLIGFTALAFWLFGSAEDPQNNNTVTTNTEQVEEIELTSNSNSEQCDTLDL